MIGVGIVGLSAARGWAARAHLPALRAQPERFAVRASCASSPESGRAGAEAHGVPVACADAAELAARPDVDLVVVTVKVPHHEELVGAALAEGKAVLCEWPLGNGTVEAERMTIAAQGVPAFVGLQARSAPAVGQVRELVLSGAVGEILSTTVVGTGGRWGASVDREGRYLVDAANGATLLTIPFGHTLDAVCSVLGEPDRIGAVLATRRPQVVLEETGERIPMTAEDQVAVTATFGGAVATFHYRGGTDAGTGFRWEIHGTDGTVVVRGDTGHLQYGAVEVLLARGGGPLEPIVPAPPRVPTEHGSPAHVVAQAYAALADDLADGGHRVPLFADALARHRTLDLIRSAAHE
ncbi:Gfo/Idh/MocA family protein [Pseudonocardia sp. RS010]|uniref:Gfo/Idh/MocA family protein n=1 Tax=Pseudonocardia sp. RS010 TaxID=3385979 RepID=UPI00399F8D97